MLLQQKRADHKPCTDNGAVRGCVPPVHLQVNPQKRLGCGPGGIQEIKNHIWFCRINWDALTAKQLPAPILPRLTSLLDTSNFDTFDDADVTMHHPAAAAAASAAQADGKRPVQWDTWQWVSGMPAAGQAAAAVAAAGADEVR